MPFWPDFSFMLMKYILYFTPSGSLTRSKYAPSKFVVKERSYSPQMNENSDSKWLFLATASILVQTPGKKYG
jgi:hypothetical protein